MRGICVVALVVGALFVSGCGGGKGASAQGEDESFQPFRNVTVTLDGLGGPEDVGILMAQQRGYFTDAKLSVSVLTPILPVRPVQYVVTGQDDLGVTQEPQLVLAKSKGAPVIAVGSLLHRPTAAMIWLKRSHIGGIADLKGKTIAIPGVPFQELFLANVLASAGLTLDDVKVENVGYELVPALVGGRADAIFGGSWNLEGIELEERGLKPVVTRPARLGFPSYNEAMVIARSDLVAKDPRLIQDFMSAVARGTAVAVADPRAAADAIEEAGLGGPKPSRKTLEAELTATLPLLSKGGYMYSEEAIRLVDWMHEQGMIDQFPTPLELLNNEYVAWRP
jgi:ABC-type nitrate/sulfonate/bicarbonate transport system substrate-binding protein